MAVQPQTPYKEYTANGSTKSFALEFDCENQDHLIVLVDEVEPVVGTWSLSNGAVVFSAAPTSGKKITIQRNTPFRRDEDFQSYDNSFRPPGVNNGFDKIWLKLQELGVADWLLKLYVDRLHQEQKAYIDQKDTQLQNNINNLSIYVDLQDAQLQQNINNLKDYVDDRDDELRAYLMEEIRKQGVALDQLDDYYNYLMERLAQIAVDKGWDASFIVSADGSTQQEINDFGGAEWWNKPGGYKLGATVKLANGDIVKSTVANNTDDPNTNMSDWVKVNNASQIIDETGKNQQEINQYLFPFYNLKRFGVKFDGVTDDRLALQTAINHMNSTGGGTLIAPSGTCLINSKTVEDNTNADTLIKLKANVSIVGAGKSTVFEVGAIPNKKFYLFYNYTDNLGNISLSNFTIDGNGQSNIVTAASGFDQWLVATAQANSVSIENVHATNAAGRQCFSIGSNSFIPTVQNASIKGCSVYKVANDIVGNELQADHSSIYISVANAVVTGNTFKNDSSASVATAIECHSVQAVVTGNLIENYNLGVITAATVRSVNDKIISNNIIKANMCWQAWTTTGNDISRAVFEGNTCVQYSTSAGRSILDLANRVAAPVTGSVLIHGNNIFGSGATINSSGEHGVAIGDIALLSIKSNTFKNVVGRPLHLGAITSTNVVEVSFESNEVINCNTTINASYKDAIAFNTVTHLKRLSIKRNNFVSDSSNFSNRVVSGTCTISNFEFEDNTETGAGFTSVAAWTAAKLLSSKIRHITKITGKPTIAANPGSNWTVISPSDGASLREYKRLGGADTVAYWTTLHYVNNAKPVGFPSFQGDRAINMNPSTGSPSEWVCIVAGTPGVWIPHGYLGNPTATTANLQSSSAIINTTDKFIGKTVINSTDSKMYYATGPAVTDTWKTFDGVTTLTPV